MVGELRGLAAVSAVLAALVLAGVRGGAATLTTPSPSPTPTPLPSSLILAPAHGQSADTFGVTYTVDCFYQGRLAIISWDTLTLARQQLGKCARGAKTLSITLTAQPLAQAAAATTHTVAAEADLVDGALITGAAAQARATYVIDPAPVATQPPVGAPPQLASSGVAPPPWMIGVLGAAAGVLATVLTTVVLRHRFRGAHRRTVAVQAALSGYAPIASVAEPQGATTHSIRVHAQPGTRVTTVKDVPR